MIKHTNSLHLRFHWKYIISGEIGMKRTDRKPFYLGAKNRLMKMQFIINENVKSYELPAKERERVPTGGIG